MPAAQRKPRLRAVGGAPRRKDVAEAAASNSELELLVAMRDRVAGTVADPDCPPRDLAALTRRLMELAKEIQAAREREREAVRDAEVHPDEAWSEEAL